jgi:DNA-binding NarL/FixJ family response regulator
MVPASSNPPDAPAATSSSAPGGDDVERALKVAVFDDVVAARGEQFHIPGLDVDVFAHADDAVATCLAAGYALVFMDFAMGPGRQDGTQATVALRAAGFAGRIIATSSDPAANAAMIAVGADEGLAKKAHLRSYLVHLGGKHLADIRGR